MKKMISLMITLAMLTVIFTGCSTAPAQSSAPATSSAEATSSETIIKVDWPTQSVQLIVASTAGGLADTHARIVADYLQKKTGVPFAIVNQPDGGGIVAYDTVRNSKPDGTTLLFHHSNFLINCVTGFYEADPLSDFTTIAALESAGAMVVIVPANSPYQTLDDYINDALARPGEVSFGIQTGGASHFLGALLSKDKDVKLNYIEVGNQTEKIASLLGGFIDACHVSPSAAKQYIESGDVRALCSSDSVVDPNFPDFIPAADMGYPSAVYMPYFWLIGPKDMDPALCEAINIAFKDIQDDPEMQQAFANQASSYQWKNYEDSQKQMEEQLQMHREVAAMIGMVG